MKRILTLDQGTTSSRALVFDERGAVLGSAQHEFEQHFPRPGWVEHDADEIVGTQWRAAEDAWRAAGEPTIDAVGITNQRETVVVFDRSTGEPIHRAIVWQDRRTARSLDALRPRFEARVREWTGLPLDPYFSAAKIAWILDAVPGARAAAQRGELGACTIDAWLIYRLTDGRVFATEPSNASRTSLYDLHSGEWSEELCEIFAVPRVCLPEVRDSAGDFGVIQRDGREWPITGVLGDQQAALFGHGGTAPGDTKCTYGTGAFWLTHAGAVAPTSAAADAGMLATVASQLGGTRSYALEGSVLVAGALVQWLRDGLGIIEFAAAIEALAREVDDSGGVVIVPAFAGLGTPTWDADARGLIVGLTRGTTRAHLARAALEAIALQVHDVFEAVCSVSSFVRPTRLRVDGGATANRLLLELQAAISEVEVVRPDNLETTALGASRMALLGAMQSDDPADLPQLESAELCIAAGDGVSAATAASLRKVWPRAVAGARGWQRVLDSGQAAGESHSD